MTSKFKSSSPNLQLTAPPIPGILTSSVRQNTTTQRFGKSVVTSGLTRGLSVLSRKSDADVKRAFKYPARVLDDQGNDVTPLSLLGSERKSRDADKETQSDQSNTQQTLLQQSSVQRLDYFAFSKSKSQLSSSMITAEMRSEFSDETGDLEGTKPTLPVKLGDTEDDEVLDKSLEKDGLERQTRQIIVKSKRDKPVEMLTDLELSKIIKFTLQETETMWIFDMKPTLISSESEEAEYIKFKNEQYQELLRARPGNDRYVEKGMNTFDNAHISKFIQTDPVDTRDERVIVTAWDMYDTYQDMAAQEKKGKSNDAEEEEMISIATEGDDQVTGDNDAEQAVAAVDTNIMLNSQDMVDNTAADKSTSRRQITSSSSTSDSTLLGSRSSTAVNLVVSNKINDEDILKSDSFYQTLFIMEQALNLNTYQEKLAHYRGFLPAVASGRRESTKGLPNLTTPHLDLLWRFTCPVTRGRNICTMAWNKQNADILAVGYGQFEYKDQKTGLVCCWSLKNIDAPERIYHLPSGVTCVDWSNAHPSLLAIGTYDGIIYVFDSRTRSTEPLIKTSNLAGRHIGPVRQVEWVMQQSGKTRDYTEVLVSISDDGRIAQWSIRKGFESSDLMKLKRIFTKTPGLGKQKEKKADALISRNAFGTSIAFNKKSPNMYLVGTADGHIHRCSCSYNEQFLENYFGHTSPVYELKWSPFVTDVFLSCSADWTMKLWHLEKQKFISNFQSSAKSVNSIDWSPYNAVIFACVNDGAVEIWNLLQSTLDPIIVEKNVTDTIVATKVLFSLNSQILVVGDSEGQVNVYKMNCFPPAPETQGEALIGIITASITSQMTK